MILLIGCASIASAIAYTGGPYPLGYHGLGDVFVFIFFGLVAVCGTTLVEIGHVPALAVACAIPVGALATAILVVNNLRDRVTDLGAGKRTLAVRYGRGFALGQYRALIAVSYLTPVGLALSGSTGPGSLDQLALAAIGAQNRASRDPATEGRALNPLLAATAKLLAIFGLLFALGLSLRGLLAQFGLVERAVTLSVSVVSTARTLSRPAHNARAHWSERSSCIVTLQGESGVRGQGEAAPLPGFSPDSLPACEAALSALDLQRQCPNGSRRAKT